MTELRPLPLVLDLFSGTGSATEPFVECGKHRVVRVDIAGRPDVRADVRRLPLDVHPEFVWASPPCDDLTDVPWHADLRIPSRGVALFMEALKLVNFWGCRYIIVLDGISLPSAYGKWRLPPSPDRKMLRSMIPRPLAEAVHTAVCA